MTKHLSIYNLFALLACFTMGLLPSFENNSTVRVPVAPVDPVGSQEVEESSSSPSNTIAAHIPTPEQKVCNDASIKPIWNALRRNREIRDALDDNSSPTDCRDAFEIRYVDLNRDGRKEILARAVTIPFCGAVGNCDLFVLEHTRKGPRLLLHANDYVDATEMGKQVLRKRTNGYLDILSKGHFSVAETSYTTYRWNGRKYVEASCKYEVPKYKKRGELEWEFISCREFDRRLDRELNQLVNRR